MLRRELVSQARLCILFVKEVRHRKNFKIYADSAGYKVQTNWAKETGKNSVLRYAGAPMKPLYRNKFIAYPLLCSAFINHCYRLMMMMVLLCIQIFFCFCFFIVSSLQMKKIIIFFFLFSNNNNNNNNHHHHRAVFFFFSTSFYYLTTYNKIIIVFFLSSV